MHIEKINYQRTFNLGSYESVRIGAEVMINAGEDAKKAFEVAKNFVEEFQRENHPHTYGHDSTPDIPIIPKRETSENILHQNHDAIPEIGKLSTTDKTIMAIKSFTELKGVNGLESFKLIVKGKPELEEAYAKKYIELQMNGIANNNELMTR